jgi:alpha-ketoglutarate-dependent taurine dioxygenase
MALQFGPFQPLELMNAQHSSNFGLSTSKSFPLALQTTSSIPVQEAIAAISKLRNTGQLLTLLNENGGALLLRGIPIRTPADYSEVAHAFGFAAHEEVGRPPLRTVLARNVKTANEGPPELPIWPHNEYGWSTIHPAWLTFCALDVPPEGGETPIISSIGLAKVLEQRAPEFVEKLRKKGVRYLYRYSREQKLSTVGATVLAAYGKEVEDGDDEETLRKKVEREVKRHSNRFEWHEDGSLSVTHIVPSQSLASRARRRNIRLTRSVIRKHSTYQLPTWFGNLTSAWGRSRHHGATKPPFLGDDGGYHPLPEYGDGEPIEIEYLDLALSIAESLQVDIQWQQGDIVLIDVSGP